MATATAKKHDFLKRLGIEEVNSGVHGAEWLKKPTGGELTGKEAATGPLMFQGDHGPVTFRNVKITPKK